jgi:hypothetical protein
VKARLPEVASNNSILAILVISGRKVGHPVTSGLKAQAPGLRRDDDTGHACLSQLFQAEDFIFVPIPIDVPESIAPEGTPTKGCRRGEMPRVLRAEGLRA